MGRPKSSENPVVVTLKVDVTVRDALKDLASDKDLTFSSLVRDILEGWLEDNGTLERVKLTDQDRMSKALELLTTIAGSLEGGK